MLSEINNLRQDFQLHQAEITKIGEQLKEKDLREAQAKVGKKNSSPGLIKKSLDSDRKYAKKQSPTNNKELANLFG